MTNSESVIYHKSSCITCKNSIKELDRMGIDLQKRDFFKEPFSESELKKIIKISGKKAKEFLRKRDKMYTELELERGNFSESEIIKFMIKYPGLIKRPIILKKNSIFLGKINSVDLK